MHQHIYVRLGMDIRYFKVHAQLSQNPRLQSSSICYYSRNTILTGEHDAKKSHGTKHQNPHLISERPCFLSLSTSQATDITKKKLPFLPLIFSLLYWYHHPRKSTIKWKTVRLCMIEFKNSCNLPRMNSILHLIFFSKLRFLEHILLSAGNISNGLCVSWTTEWWQIHQFFAYM